MSQSSLSKLVECLLEPANTASTEEKEEAVIT
jgi:hypothetical protein